MVFTEAGTDDNWVDEDLQHRHFSDKCFNAKAGIGSAKGRSISERFYGRDVDMPDHAERRLAFQQASAASQRIKLDALRSMYRSTGRRNGMPSVLEQGR